MATGLQEGARLEESVDMCRLKTMYMMICRILFVLTVGFLSVSAGFAQVGGKISGRATDLSGAIVPGVQVSATNSRTNVVSATQTDRSG